MVAAVLLTGCSAFGVDDADDPEPTAPQSSVPSSAGDPLTREQVNSAVPPLIDWSPADPLGAGDLSQATITPAACRGFVDEMLAGQPTYEATDSLSQGAFGPFLELTVSTYHDQAPSTDNVADFHEALADCPEMTVDGPEGTLTFQVSPLAFPNLGDEAVALRLHGQMGFLPITVDVATVVVGHNTYSATQVNTGSATSREDMVAALEATMENAAAA